MKISVAIITLNEEDNIGTAITSVAWADEIIVVDSGSTDRTVEIAEQHQAKVIHQDWLGFGKQKQIAAEACSNEWLLSLDADEEISPELRNEIESLAKSDLIADGYRIPRETTYMDRPIRHSGWYPDYQLRLFKKSKGRWKDMVVHESVEMADGSVIEKLSGNILHRSVNSVGEHYRMIGERYAPLGAEQMALDGRRTSPLKIMYSGPMAFIRSYLLKLGFLDGLPGFSIAMFAGIHAYLKHLIRYEQQKQEPHDKRVE